MILKMFGGRSSGNNSFIKTRPSNLSLRTNRRNLHEIIIDFILVPFLA